MHIPLVTVGALVSSHSQNMPDTEKHRHGEHIKKKTISELLQFMEIIRKFSNAQYKIYKGMLHE